MSFRAGRSLSEKSQNRARPRRRHSSGSHPALERACAAALGRFEPLENRVMMAVDPVIVYSFEDAPTGTTVEDTSVEGTDNDGILRGDPAGVPNEDPAADDPALFPDFMPATGTGADSPSPAGGQFMRFLGDSAFNGTGGRVQTQDFLGGVDATNNTQGPMSRTASMGVWMRTTSVGTGAPWQWPGVAGAEHQGDGNDIFWGIVGTDGRIASSAGDAPEAYTTTPANTGEWVHFATTRNHTTGRLRVYRNGAIQQQLNDDLGDKGANFNSVGAIGNVNTLRRQDGYAHYNGDLDQFEIFDRELDFLEVARRYGPATTAVPAAPAPVSGVSTGPGSNTLNIGSAPGALGYIVYRSTTGAPGSFTEVGLLSNTATQFIDRNVTPGQTLHYQVAAYNSSGVGALSAVVPITTATTGTGATAQYFNEAWWGAGNQGDPNIGTHNLRVATNPDVRTFAANIDFDYGNNSPHPTIRVDRHSTVFTGRIVIPADANGNGTPNEPVALQFVSNTDDDGFLFVEDSAGNQILTSSDPGGHGQRDATNLLPVDMVEGQSYDFVLMQAEGGGGSGVHLRWDNPATGTRQAVPESMLQMVMDTTAAGGLRAPSTLALEGTPPTERMVMFTFTDASSNETRFELLRSPGATFNAANAVVVGTAGINSGLINDAQAVAGVFSYAIRAANPDGVSAPSTAVVDNVTVPAIPVETTGASAYYFQNGAWNAGRLGNYAGSGPGDTRLVGGVPDVAELVASVDFDYADTPGMPTGMHQNYHSTIHTGEILIPADFDGDGTLNETIQIQFVGNTDDHGAYFVNGQLAAQDLQPRGQGNYENAPPLTLTEGQRYDFVVFQAEQEGGSGVHLRWRNPSNPDPATNIETVPGENLFPTTGPAAAPTGITGLGLGNIVVLNWTDVATNEVAYLIERAATAAGPFTTLALAPVNATNFSDATTTPNTNYVYRVTAINYEGRGATASQTINSGTPSAPLAATVTSGVARTAGPRIGFRENSNNEQVFTIQRRLASEPDTAFVDVGTVAATAPGSSGQTLYFQDTSAAVNTTYVYRVVTSNAAGATNSNNFTVANNPGNGTGLRATYFEEWYNTRQAFIDNADFGIVLRDPIPAVNTFGGGDPGAAGLNNGGGGGAPTGVDVDGNPTAIDAETFSGLFTGYFRAEFSEPYTFRSNSDDGVSLEVIDAGPNGTFGDVDDVKIVDFDGSGFLRGMGGGFADNAGTATLVAGRFYQVRASFAENTGGAGFRFGYSSASTGTEVFPTELLFPDLPVGGLNVTQVFVNGPTLTNGAAAFKAAAGVDATFGYAVPGGAVQTTPLSWVGGINSVSIRFSDDVAAALAQGDLVINGSGGPVATTGFTYDAATRTGTWTFAAVTRDKLRFLLDDAGISGLDGEWTNPTEAFPGVGGDAYPSGDGSAGGDFNFRVNVLHGDVSGDGVVNATDVAEIKRRLTRRPNDGVTDPLRMYTIFSDITGDGVINANDLAQVKARLTHRINTLPNPATAILFA